MGDLLTVVASSLHPKPGLGGGRKRVKREIPGLRAKPPPIFIAGELEICLSLPILRRWTLRGPREEEGSHIGCPNPPLMAMPGLPWAKAGLPQGLGTQGSVFLSGCLVLQEQSQPPPPPPPKNKDLRLRLGPSGAWKWAVHQRSSRIFYWKKK